MLKELKKRPRLEDILPFSGVWLSLKMYDMIMDDEITYEELRVVLVLEALPGCSFSDTKLARIAGVDRARITNVLENLVKQGLVKQTEKEGLRRLEARTA